MAVSVRLNKEDEALIRNYAQMKNLSVSEAIRQAAMEKIEDEFDLKVYYEAMAEYQVNPVTYTHEEVGKMLGLK